MANKGRCHLLELPAEMRLHIYEHLWDTKCEPLLILRDDSTIQQPMHRWFTHANPSLLRTCKTIYNEAVSVMYQQANFRFQIYIGDGWPKYQYSGPLSPGNPLMKQIQHADVTLHLVDALHIDPALHRLGMLANALERAKSKFESCAELRSLKVTFKAVTSYNMAVTRDLVAYHREKALMELGQECQPDGRVDVLFRRMLMIGNIVAIR